MKNIIVLALLIAALVYGQRSCAPLNERAAADKPASNTIAGGSAREWQQAPSAMMDMNDAMGGASGGPARAARDAVTQQLGR
jgi:hypothetical protein